MLLVLPKKLVLSPPPPFEESLGGTERAMRAAGWDRSVGGAEFPCADHLSSEKEKKYYCIAICTCLLRPPSPCKVGAWLPPSVPTPMSPSPRAMLCSLNEPSPLCL